MKYNKLILILFVLNGCKTSSQQEINILNLQESFIAKDETQFLKQFPTGFNQFRNYFGWNSVNDEPQELYEECNNYIDYWFDLLNKEKYKKHENNIIEICTNGSWRPDAVNYFQDKSLKYIKEKRKYYLINDLKDEQTKSILFFLFDSPHPQIDTDFASNLTPSKRKILNELFETNFSDTEAPKINFHLLDTVLKNLNLKKKNCKIDWVSMKGNPNNIEETIMVIPEIVDEHYIELNSYILIVNTKTGKIINKFFESSKTNRWVSDSAELRGISVDTAPYNLTDNKTAFGIRVRYVGSSIANPYENETISLFIKSENTLKKVLKNYNVMEYGGERVMNCVGEFVRENKVLSMTPNKTNNYYDILVKSKITESIDYEDENGGCESEITITTKKIVLQYDGTQYKPVDKSTKKKDTKTSKIDFNLIDAVLKNLKIKKKDCKLDLVVIKEMPNNPEETIVVIPEVVDEGEQYFELNSYILIVNTETGKITHQYFESSKTNQWFSDAIQLREITIDTAPYNVTDDKRAFGIRVRYVGSSHANPYENETISLFVKSGNVLNTILKNFVILNDHGEWNTHCVGEFLHTKNTLIISKKKTNGYFDILVKSKITESINYEDENGDCDSKENNTTEQITLKFNGKEYKNVLKY